MKLGAIFLVILCINAIYIIACTNVICSPVKNKKTKQLQTNINK